MTHTHSRLWPEPRAPLRDGSSAIALDWRGGPTDLLAAWPADRALVCLVSGDAPGAGAKSRSRWSIFAVPVDERRPTSLDPAAELAQVIGCVPPTRPEFGGRSRLPFLGGWIGWISYDLGRHIEPAAQCADARADRGAEDDRRWPLFHLYRCPGAIVHDGLEGRWWRVGDTRALPELGDPLGAARAMPASAELEVSPLRSATGREGFMGSVREALELIAAGEVFQVNLSHRLSGRFAGSPRGLAARLFSSAAPAFGAWIESRGSDGSLDRAILSLSPELFLEADLGTRRVVTRPIKGTRPANTDPAELLASEKEKAELTMIVDLMRNDLGRVCRYGTVRVDSPRDIEAHAGVIHSVATVSGRLRAGVGVAELLGAAFPAGSVTGAPKVRAMRIIDAMEPVRRGPYCGAVGFVSDHGRVCWNVAIRTAALSFDPGAEPHRATGVLDYAVGAGIVAESDPESEWLETLTKARALGALVAP